MARLCHFCTKPILFVPGFRGPVDPEPVMVVPMPENGAGVFSFVVSGTGVVRARRAVGAEVGRPAYVAHRANCRVPEGSKQARRASAAAGCGPRFDATPRPKAPPAETRDLFPSPRPSFMGGPDRG